MRIDNIKRTVFCILAALFCAALPAEGVGTKIAIKIEAGESWNKKQQPQMAFWIVESGSVHTVYVTERASKKRWRFGPKEGRPESLPVWYHAAGNESGNELDAVTSATPGKGLVFSAVTHGKSCMLFAEINVSFDYNDFYTKKTSGVNGQPSVIYAAEIPENFTAGDEIELKFIGCGSVDGSNGNIEKVNSSEMPSAMTTALSIVKKISVVAR